MARAGRARVLAAGLGLAALVGVVAVERGSDGRGPDRPGVHPLHTPVLSLRRLPDLVAAPVAQRRLQADLAAWAARVPPSVCAVAVGPDGTVLLDLRGGAPMVPASTQKLVTATAALLSLDPERVTTEVLTQLLAESDNELAEQLFGEVAAAAGGVDEVLRRHRIGLDGVAVVDGSGRSRANRVTCRLLIDLLRRPDTGPRLRAGLATAGETGTLADRFAGSSVVGHLRAKSGSLSNHDGLAGVVADGDGEVTFAYLAAASPEVTFDVVAHRQAQQQLAEILLAWPRVPPPGVLGPRPARSG